MSAREGSYGCRITVTTSDADVLRDEAKKVLMNNHDEFEDFLDHLPVKQLHLADIYRDAIAVIDALGWDARLNPPHTTITNQIRSVEALNRIFATYSDATTT